VRRCGSAEVRSLRLIRFARKTVISRKRRTAPYVTPNLARDPRNLPSANFRVGRSAPHPRLQSAKADFALSQRRIMPANLIRESQTADVQVPERRASVPPGPKGSLRAWARTALARTPGSPIREGGFRVVVAANLYQIRKKSLHSVECGGPPVVEGESSKEVLHLRHLTAALGQHLFEFPNGLERPVRQRLVADRP
jgi:hypothetical protein